MNIKDDAGAKIAELNDPDSEHIKYISVHHTCQTDRSSVGLNIKNVYYYILSQLLRKRKL